MGIEQNRVKFRIEDYYMNNLSLEEVFMKSVLDVPKPPVNIPQLSKVMLVVGTRGDVQPFLALAIALALKGHNIRLATHAKFKDFVEGEVQSHLYGNNTHNK